ncbi:glycosyltransferase family 4 protein [Knoellia sp. p5-6-4]|uniref:glycosyltransferase family 4 protein n=1 Tax=unclassified Knoellia TaxID=2618719 RepID=UPI0023DC9C98|nr:glycosyltransferase family 4 protein [Knoellia sp. p5-6-4]MDF2146430.1 glycosyltransferase family 4 protein [Knoellia sp. p5-6-4]
MSTPRVLWLHSHFELPTGGTKYIHEVTRRLGREVPVTVMVEHASSLWRDRYRESGTTLVEVGGPTSTSLGYWAAFPFFLLRDLRAIAKEAKHADVVVTSFFPMPWLAARLTRRTRVRHVSLCFEPFPFFHDTEVIGLYPRHRRALLAVLAAVYQGLDRGGVASAERVMTLNESTAGQIARVYGRDDAVPVYAGVDTELFRPYSPDELDDLVTLFGDGPLVVHSTDYSPIKRTDLALEAFAVARRAVPDARMVVTSTRESASELAALEDRAASLGISDAVTFAGFLAFGDLPRLYSLATVVLQTGTAAGSGATTMSLPVKEALACGTAVVRSAATHEDVQDGVSGYLVDPRDAEATGGRLADLLADRDRAAAMGMAGRGRIESDYTWDRVVQKVLREVCS